MSNESPTERIKKASDGLRGTLPESLQDEHTGAIREDDQVLVKFHGMYLQDDRDRREARAAKKLERLYSFMVRLRLPGGYLTAKQWESIHHIAGEHSTGVIKITSRQTVQLHGILKSHAKPTHKEFNEASLDSIAACGDVNRNVLATSNPATSALHAEIAGYADKISLHLLPKTRAYYEIWLDEEQLAEKNEEDPLYENRYLPRKFKVAIAIPPYNDVDVLTNDVGLIAIIEKEKLIGFNLAVGGGMGTTHGNTETYPRLATVIGYVPKEKVLDAVYEVATVQRDFGNRSDRKLSRLKYTVDRMGIPAFKAELEKRLGFTLGEAKSFSFTQRNDDFGWQQDHAGNWHYTLFVENGRVLDDVNVPLKTALLEIARLGKSAFRFTCNQNVVICDVAAKDKKFIDALLQEYGLIKHTDSASGIRKNAIACVALNTCSLALAEAQRYLPSLLTKLEFLLDKHDLKNEAPIVRMTGCPNGCARPYIAEIGFVGTAYGRYNLHIGSDHEGLRLAKLYKENLDETQLLETIDNLFAAFKKERLQQERFGDFAFRALLQ